MQLVAPRALNGGATLRVAVPADIPEILDRISDLAVYEREPRAAQATEDALTDALYGDDPVATAYVVAVPRRRPDRDGPDRILGVAIWFRSFSTWTGRAGIWLEDLFVVEAARGRGHGRALLAALASTCIANGYTRLEWSVLDWNAPSIALYRALGATGMDEWTTYRIDGDALASLGADRTGRAGR